MSDQFTIVVDSREQLPWTFPGDVAVERRALTAGDYSVIGFETEIGIERKSLDDLLATLSWGRERFERELGKLAKMRRSCIVVEAAIDDVLVGLARSRMSASSVLGSIASLHAQFGVPVLWMGSRPTAAAFALRWLAKCAAHAQALRLGAPAPTAKKRRSKAAPARPEEPEGGGSSA